MLNLKLEYFLMNNILNTEPNKLLIFKKRYQREHEVQKFFSFDTFINSTNLINDYFRFSTLFTRPIIVFFGSGSLMATARPLPTIKIGARAFSLSLCVISTSFTSLMDRADETKALATVTRSLNTQED